MERKNPFESLRNPGVRGSVATHFNVMTIFSLGADSTLQIRTAELSPDTWGFGFYLKSGDILRHMLPGEGSGWFRTENDAALYALGHIRYGSVALSPDMRLSVDIAISKLRNVPLFDEFDGI